MERIEQNLWSSFKEELETLNYSVARLKLKFEILDSTEIFAVQNGLPGPFENMQTLFEEIDALDRQALALNIAYSYTQSLKAGAQYSTSYPGDFDIMVQEGALTPAEIEAARVDLSKLAPRLDGLGIAPFIIWAGVAAIVVISGAVTTVAVMSAKEKELESKVDGAQIALEQKIADNPATLPAWSEYKDTQQGEQRSLVDKLLGKGAGKSILAGAAGVAALVVGGYFLMKLMDKRRAQQ